MFSDIEDPIVNKTDQISKDGSTESQRLERALNELKKEYHRKLENLNALRAARKKQKEEEDATTEKILKIIKAPPSVSTDGSPTWIMSPTSTKSASPPLRTMSLVKNALLSKTKTYKLSPRKIVSKVEKIPEKSKESLKLLEETSNILYTIEHKLVGPDSHEKKYVPKTKRIVKLKRKESLKIEPISEPKPEPKSEPPEPKKESKEETKEKTKKDSKEKTEEEPKKESKEKAKKDSKEKTEEPRTESKEKTKKDSKEKTESKEKTKKDSKEKTEEPKTESKEKAKKDSKEKTEEPKTESKEKTKKDSKEKTESKEKTKKDSKEKTEEDSKKESKEKTKKDSKEKTEEPKTESKEKTKKDSKEKTESKEKAKKDSKEKTEEPKTESKEKTKKDSKEKTEEGPKKESKEKTKKDSKEKTEEELKKESKDTIKTESKEESREEFTEPTSKPEYVQTAVGPDESDVIKIWSSKNIHDMKCVCECIKTREESTQVFDECHDYCTKKSSGQTSENPSWDKPLLLPRRSRSSEDLSTSADASSMEVKVKPVKSVTLPYYILVVKEGNQVKSICSSCQEVMLKRKEPKTPIPKVGAKRYYKPKGSTSTYVCKHCAQKVRKKIDA